MPLHETEGSSTHSLGRFKLSAKTYVTSGRHSSRGAPSIADSIHSTATGFGRENRRTPSALIGPNALEDRYRSGARPIIDMNQATGRFHIYRDVNQHVYGMLKDVKASMEAAQGDGIYIINEPGKGMVILLGRDLLHDVNISVRHGTVYIHARPPNMSSWLLDKLGKGYYESFVSVRPSNAPLGCSRDFEMI